MKKNLDIKKPRYSEQISPVHWLLVISRFHCKRDRVITSILTNLMVMSKIYRSHSSSPVEFVYSVVANKGISGNVHTAPDEFSTG